MLLEEFRICLKNEDFFCPIQTDVNFGFEGVDFKFPPLLIYNKYIIIIFLKLVCIYFGICYLQAMSVFDICEETEGLMSGMQ